MIAHPDYEVQPWALREVRLDLSVLAQSESIFALSNGHIGLRANLDEGEPHGLPGTYLNAFYQIRPLPYAEPAYGDPEVGQTLVNVTNGKLIRLLVDDEPLDVRYGRLAAHERVLDFRDGVLRRRVEWVSPTGRRVRVRSTRLVSFTQRAVAAILYEIEPLSHRTRLVLQSELVANEPLPVVSGRDPRVAPAPSSRLKSLYFTHRGYRVVLAHATEQSGLLMAAAMDHLVDGGEGLAVSTESDPDLGRVTLAGEFEPGERLRLVKLLAYGWSGQRSLPALRDQVEGALVAAARTGWEGLLREQRSYLQRFWERADVEIEGDRELQQALRFSLFHVLQSAVRAEDRAIPAKGLTGPGYEGHTFWDMDTFVLHALTYAAPEAVASALRWRHSLLPLARERARLLGLKGAAFPWRTIAGQGSSAYWPAGMAAFHVNADIADATLRYCNATEDTGFERGYGLELLVETARLWRSLGHGGRDGRFHIDGVTGPDEYSALADDNVYTNLMARRNLLAAADAAERHRDVAERLAISQPEIDFWREAAQTVAVPFDEELGVHSQAERFTRHERWDFEHTRPDQYPLMLHFPYFDIYRRQVVKQADLVLALHLCGDWFSLEEKRRAFDYYEAITVRDSSLSSCTQAVVAAEVGHLDLAYDYLAESALMDLHDLQHNVRDGLHIASLAGSWLAAVAGFGGLRDHGGQLAFAPRLPHSLTRLTFRVCFRGRLLKVEVRASDATYELVDGGSLAILHHGQELELEAGQPLSMAVPAMPSSPRPSQPPGRDPDQRHEGSR